MILVCFPSLALPFLSRTFSLGSHVTTDLFSRYSRKRIDKDTFHSSTHAQNEITNLFKFAFFLDRQPIGAILFDDLHPTDALNYRLLYRQPKTAFLHQNAGDGG